MDGRAPKTPLTKLTREPELGVYEWDAIHSILDQGFICHLGVEVDGQPFVVPTLYALLGDDIVIHGSSASRTLRRAAAGAPVCLTVTHVDGIVFARSVFNHSANYRCAMVFGQAELIEDAAEKRQVAHDFFEAILPGRWDEVRPPTEQEWKATAFLRLPLTEASAKVSSGPPDDDAADYDLPAWAGTVALHRAWGEPKPDPRLPDGVETSHAVARLRDRYPQA
jgi:nitroimidazol reductase NimA-like FMN-containing flavoprotein (pyridoxamine 5'-phosphate oxidase superfamily)